MTDRGYPYASLDLHPRIGSRCDVLLKNSLRFSFFNLSTCRVVSLPSCLPFCLSVLIVTITKDTILCPSDFVPGCLFHGYRLCVCDVIFQSVKGYPSKSPNTSLFLNLIQLSFSFFVFCPLVNISYLCSFPSGNLNLRVFSVSFLLKWRN